MWFSSSSSFIIHQSSHVNQSIKSFIYSDNFMYPLIDWPSPLLPSFLNTLNTSCNKRWHQPWHHQWHHQFIIRYIDPASPDFLHSSNLYDVAKRNNLYNPIRDGPQLDFLKTFAPARAHSPYVTRRVWRVFGLVAPSYVAAVKLSPFTDPYASEYPFSVKPDVPLSPQDLMHVQRDHYEGTQFDLTKGRSPIFTLSQPSFIPNYLHSILTLIPPFPSLRLVLSLTNSQASLL